jgi:D-alanine-D-alanine ligase
MNTPIHSSMHTPVSAKAMGRVAVIMGGDSAEREISIRSGNGVLAALQRSGVNAVAFDPATRSLQDLVTEKFDRVFLILHGRSGEDGTIQGALEWLKIPYTGSGVLASAIAMDKAMTKRIWQAFGIPTPAFEVLTEGFNANQVAATLGLPIAVKPLREGSSLGFVKVSHAHELQAAFDHARQFDPQVIAEEFITGREFTCALIDDTATGVAKALPVVEITAPEGNYDFQHKYFGNETKYTCPADLPKEITQDMQALCQRAYECLGCEGWARADILWQEGKPPMLLEINTAPGMTDHSLVPMAAAAAGIPYDQLVLQILAGARLKMGGQAA